MVLDLIEVTAAGALTALATGIGAIPVFMLGERAKNIVPLLLGIAIGVMGVASVVGLLIPGLDNGTWQEVFGGVATGTALLLVGKRFLSNRWGSISETQPTERKRVRSQRQAILVFAALFVHSLPEGFAIGTAYASSVGGLALFVFIAIAVQNIPEGTSVAIPMQIQGSSPKKQFWAAVGTSAPQPIGAAIAYLATSVIASLLPFSFGFAAGAMLALIIFELLPEAVKGREPLQLTLGTLLGSGAMLLLSSLLGV